MDEADETSSPSSEGCMFLSVPSDEGADLLYFDVDGSTSPDGPCFVVGILFPNDRAAAPTTTQELLTWFKFYPHLQRVWSVLNHIAKRGSVDAEHG